LIDPHLAGFTARSIGNAFHDPAPEPAGKTAYTARHCVWKPYPQIFEMYSPLCHFG
jgi:hypothetical protein